ncbi:MAG: PilN domain-containing protein [Verrucomicrobia bacterium]|nr:PilN domain-containing protein [Verrucomicrobiota bacterium]
MGTSHTTGIALRPGRIEWTVLRESRKGREMVEHGQAEWTPAASGDLYATPEAQAALRQAARHVRGEVGLAADSGKTLMRVVDLPSTDPAELAGMAELQVDKFSPFPVEHMAVAVEALSKGEKSTRTLIAATQREIVEKAGAALRQAGVHAHRVDVEVLGWWQLLRDAGAIPEKGCKAFLLVESNGAELVLARDGQPVLFRSLGVPGESVESFIEEMVEETAYTLTAVESEIGGGDVMPMEVRLSRDMPAEGLLERLKDACAVAPESCPLEELPPLSEGVARRGLDDAARRFSLAPAAWGMEEQSRKVQRQLLAWTAGFLLVWLAAVGGLTLGLKIQRARQAGLDAEAVRLEGPAAEVRALKDRIEVFERYVDRTYSALECLREVSQLLPEGIDLTAFEYRKGDDLTLRGEATAADSIIDYVQALQQTPLFLSAKAGNIRAKGSGSERKSEFTVTAVLPGGQAPEEPAL